MGGFAHVANSGKGRGASRSRAEAAAWRRAAAWVERRREKRQAEARAITARLARERLEAKP